MTDRTLAKFLKLFPSRPFSPRLLGGEKVPKADEGGLLRQLRSMTSRGSGCGWGPCAPLVNPPASAEESW